MNKQPNCLKALADILLGERKREQPIEMFKAVADAVRDGMIECPQCQIFGQETFVRALRIIKDFGSTDEVLGMEDQTEGTWRELIANLSNYCDLIEPLRESDQGDSNCTLYDREEQILYRLPKPTSSPILPGRNGHPYAWNSPIDGEMMRTLFDFCYAFARALFTTEKRKIKLAYLSGVFTAPLTVQNPSPLHLEMTSTLGGLKTQGEQIMTAIQDGFAKTAKGIDAVRDEVGIRKQQERQRQAGLTRQVSELQGKLKAVESKAL